MHEGIKAPPGTYKYLKDIGPKLFNTGNNSGGFLIQAEPFCEETGGSCMDLIIVQVTGVGEDKYTAHVTDEDAVMSIEKIVYDRTRGVRRLEQQPRIDIMLTIIRDWLRNEDSSERKI